MRLASGLLLRTFRRPGERDPAVPVVRHRGQLRLAVHRRRQAAVRGIQLGTDAARTRPILTALPDHVPADGHRRLRGRRRRRLRVVGLRSRRSAAGYLDRTVGPSASCCVSCSTSTPAVRRSPRESSWRSSGAAGRCMYHLLAVGAARWGRPPYHLHRPRTTEQVVAAIRAAGPRGWRVGSDGATATPRRKAERCSISPASDRARRGVRRPEK